MEENINAQQGGVVESAPHLEETKNIIWAETIPRTNLVTFVTACLLLGVMNSVLKNNDLGDTGYLSLLIPEIIIFALFVLFENFVLSKKFSASSASVDKMLSGLITTRDIFFIVLCSPFVGMLLYFFLLFGWIPFVAYIVLIVKRFWQMKKGKEEGKTT
jgi:hypothetical protein